MPIMTTFKDDGSAPVKVWTTDIEDSALTQLHNLSTLPFIHKHVAVMPDVHWGMGSTVGSVIPTIKAIVPAAVGVDIGCGMVAHKLNITPEQLPDSLADVRSALEKAIPHGRTDEGGRNDRGAWGGGAPQAVNDQWERLRNDARFVELLEDQPKVLKQEGQGPRQLGTLGTGNHFVELCLDTDGGVWLMLHSGSRGIGNRIGSYFIEQAKRAMEDWHISLPNPDLAYLPEASPLFGVYWKALSWAQDYAMTNRTLMMDAAKSALSGALGLPVVTTEHAVNCHHNYVAVESHFGQNVYVTRKGAVRAREGDMGIIPGSMGARSFIVRGKGNPESFHSCSHGAGRKMSRGAAKKQFTKADLEAQTAGIECRKDSDVIDEIPGAYKDIQAVMDNQSDLVEIVAELRQVVCVKG
jgi:tRNA-splicing ligase RtcB (3'-phosphate/5'-hydroxy nucleic acid ligase)